MLINSGNIARLKPGSDLPDGGHLESKSILLIEDSASDSRLIKDALNLLFPNIKLHISPSGDDGLNFLNEKTKETRDLPNIILLDLDLPGKTGVEVLRELKTHDELKKIPVIVLTNSGAFTEVVSVYDNLGNGFIRKAMDYSLFTEKLEVLVRFWLEMVELPPS